MLLCWMYADIPRYVAAGQGNSTAMIDPKCLSVVAITTANFLSHLPTICHHFFCIFVILLTVTAVQHLTPALTGHSLKFTETSAQLTSQQVD